MTEEVASAEAVESQEAPAVEQEPAATPAPESETTWKARLAGKDRALTEAKQKLADLERRADELARWKAEREQAEMTEYERLQAQLKQREDELAAAKAEANRERLARKFPLATELLGDDPLPSEERLAAIEERLSAASAQSAPESEPEPVVDLNRPKKPIAPPVEDRSPAVLAKRLREQTPAFLADLEARGLKF